MRVGMIGLGNIGGALAVNLVIDGHEVTVYDVDSTLRDGIDGASRAESVAAVAAAAEITLLSLPTPDVVRTVADEWATAAPAGSVLVDLSTNAPDVVRELGERLTASGHHLVESPLTGGAPGAANRTLVFLLGGDDDAVVRAREVIDPLGRASFAMGPLGAGNTMKLVNSLIAFTATWSSLEGLCLAAKAGIPVADAVAVLRTAGATNFFVDRMVESIDQRDRPTQFALGLAAKDAELIVALGAALDVPTPAGASVLEVLADAVTRGLGDHDWSDLVTVAEARAQVPLHWTP